MVEYVINEIAAIGPITTNSELSISYVQNEKETVAWTITILIKNTP